VVSGKTSARAWRLRALVAACALAGFGAEPAAAALGEPDPAYGKGGVAVAAVGFPARDAHLDAAGRAVFAGRDLVEHSEGSTYRGRLIRLDATGAGDPTWGDGGVTSITGDAESIAFAPAPGGAWLVATTDGQGRLMLTRLSPDGEVNDEVSIGYGYTTVEDLEVLPDGRAILTGLATPGEGGQSMYVARLSADPAPALTVGYSDGLPRALAVDALDRVLVAGFEGEAGFVKRFKAEPAPGSGLSPDSGFATAGTRTLGIVLEDVAVLGDGRILVAGREGPGALLARLTPEGAPDSGFGGTFGTGDVAFDDLLVDVVGSVYAVGDGGPGRLRLGRFDDRGRPDPTLRDGGFRDVDAGAKPIAVALDAQERPHLLGSTSENPVAVRLQANAPPVAVIVGPDRVGRGRPTTYDASRSTDPENALRRFEWDLDGDGTFETDGGANPAIQTTFPTAGVFTVGLRVTDHRGLQSTATKQVQVDESPPAATGGAAAPSVGLAAASGSTARGVVFVRRPGETKFTQLFAGESIPNGTIVDARRGRVRITAPRDVSGATDSAVFYLGRFRITRTEGVAPYTNLTLYGGDFRGCGPARPQLRVPLARAAADSRRRKRRVVRRLWGSGKGRFRTQGRYAAATVRGTKWQIIDRCDGVKLQVVSGVVEFRDTFRATRVRSVKAGGSSFVPSPRNP
jgi:hypothetical protein